MDGSTGAEARPEARTSVGGRITEAQGPRVVLWGGPSGGADGCPGITAQGQPFAPSWSALHSIGPPPRMPCSSPLSLRTLRHKRLNLWEAELRVPGIMTHTDTRLVKYELSSLRGKSGHSSTKRVLEKFLID